MFNECKFIEVVKKIENVVQTWKWRNLTISGKISIFKSLALSKTIFVSFLSNIPNCIIERLEKIQKEFLWGVKRAKIKHSALINTLENGGLKCTDIKSKIKALQLSWVRRLYEGSFHPWKHIPLTILQERFSGNILFPNMSVTFPTKLPKF